MFLLSRRQAHAALTGVAAACAYWAAAEVGSKKPVRFGALFLLATGAMAAMAGQAPANRASWKAYAVDARLSNFLQNGGLVGGDLHINGDHYVSGLTHSHLTAPVGSSNVQVQGGSGLGIENGSLDMNSNRMDNVAGINDSQYWVPPTGGGAVVLAGGEIWMNGATIDCGNGKITHCSGVTS